jgi:uncharacterized membrane protein YcaP (DUF421 family)
MKIYEGIKLALGIGLQAQDLTFVHISLRGIVVFIFSLAMVRLADKRFMAKLSAFDAILGFVLASMMARTINGSSPFFPTLGGGFVLVALHRLLNMLSYRWGRFGDLIKGCEVVLVQEGKMLRNKMQRTSISERDLLEETRINGQVEDISAIHKATLERSGHISVIPVRKET